MTGIIIGAVLFIVVGVFVINALAGIGNRFGKRPTAEEARALLEDDELDEETASGSVEG